MFSTGSEKSWRSEEAGRRQQAPPEADQPLAEIGNRNENELRLFFVFQKDACPDIPVLAKGHLLTGCAVRDVIDKALIAGENSDERKVQ
jgi:hypothetical protein